MSTAGLERLVLDHLWQSTLFTLGVGLLVLAFRRAPAGVRYGLWFSASIKFLIPFAALAAVGRLAFGRLALGRFAGLDHAPAGAALLERAARPLAQFPLMPAPLAQALPTLPSSSPAAPVAAAIGHAGPHAALPLVLLALWALGCAAVLARWVVQAAKVRAVVRSARPLPWPAAMPVLATPSLLEPGLVGFWSPVLVVPESLPDHLAQPQIDALVAHETCHLRRRDNLTASAHMLVEALVWFHPLAWWIGARLIEERERACDEAVVRAGHDRAAYARSLIEVCRVYLQTPLLCVAGASGSNLKARVESIMTAPLSSPLSRFRKALLLAAGAGAIATPVAAGLLTTPAGHAVVAKVQALASSAPAQGLAPSVPAPVTASAPSASPALERIVLARNQAVLDPNVALAATDATPIPLAREAVEPQALQIQLASVDAASTAPRPVQAADLADPKGQTLDFVKSYAEVGLYGWVVRLDAPICAQVLGLPPDQAAAVKSRIEAIGQAMSLRLYSVYQTCGGFKNVQVLFTNDAQKALDELNAKQPSLVGDAHSLTRNVKVVSRPVQAWYRTRCYEAACPPDPVAYPTDTVTVLVDARRTAGVKLGAIADYAAMLALAQPRFPDRCQVLPSVLDLFAGACSDRPAPTGITPTDLAYLKALYTAGRPITEPEWSRAEGGATVDQIAGRMAMLMQGRGSMPSPGAKPEQR